MQAGNYDNLSGTASSAAGINHAELQAYIGRIEATISDAMSEETDSFVLEFELTMTPGQVNVRLLSDIDLNPDFETFITGTVQKIDPYPVTSPIHIRVPFYINQE